MNTKPNRGSWQPGVSGNPRGAPPTAIKLRRLERAREMWAAFDGLLRAERIADVNGRLIAALEARRAELAGNPRRAADVERIEARLTAIKFEEIA